jgi:sialate O-acetylesterase
VRLAHVFGEHMVLQRDRPLTLWGQATPGQSVLIGDVWLLGGQSNM